MAGFLGAPRMNLLPCTVVSVSGGEAMVVAPALGTRGISVPLRDAGAVTSGMAAVLGFRPEALSPGGPGTELALRAEVVENMGAARYLYTATRRDAAIVAEIPRGRRLRPGEAIALTLPPDAGLLFAPEGRRL